MVYGSKNGDSTASGIELPQLAISNLLRSDDWCEIHDLN